MVNFYNIVFTETNEKAVSFPRHLDIKLFNGSIQSDSTKLGTERAAGGPVLY